MITSLFKKRRSTLMPAWPRQVIPGVIAIPVPITSLALFQRFGSGERFFFDSFRVRLIGLISLLLLTACATPQQRLDRTAVEFDFQRLALESRNFQHIAYRNRIPLDTVLHVYLDGDGSPWQRRDRINTDPTPRHPLVLQLMAQDRQAALYLGRPCYHGLHQAPGCSPWLWTAARYGRPVVDSLVIALREQLRDRPDVEVVLIGYSGGGALAMLMAEQLPQTRLILTIAANLDVAAWTRWHDYSPLSGSLDPATRPPLTIPQWHLLGEQDENVPPAISEPVIAGQPCARMERIAEFDHRCCWSDIWPAVLQRLASAPPACPY